MLGKMGIGIRISNWKDGAEGIMGELKRFLSKNWKVESGMKKAKEKREKKSEIEENWVNSYMMEGRSGHSNCSSHSNGKEQGCIMHEGNCRIPKAGVYLYTNLG